MNLYEAIFVRKSIRSYNMEELEQSSLDNLMIFAKHISMLEEQYKVQYKIIQNKNDNKVFKTGFAVRAPYYLVLYSKQDNDHLINAGFVLGQLSLYLASRGIGSCFMSNVRLKEEYLDNNSGMEPVAVLAFGKAKESLYRDNKKIHRLTEEQTTIYKSEAGSMVKTMVRAARYAPSNMNNQPWRFVVYDNRVHVFCRKDLMMERFMGRTKRIDIGIMLSFLFQAAEEQWMDINIKKMDNIADKYFKNNNYVISVLVK